jgi:hypothetical protein
VFCVRTHYVREKNKKKTKFKEHMSSVVNLYKLSPVSKEVFTMVLYHFDSVQNKNVEDSSQQVNLEKLNETGLHKVLFILKNKVDPAKLGTAEEAWRRLPASKVATLDQDLRKAYPEKMLRILLEQFFEIWSLETIEARNYGNIDKAKFDAVTGWPALHSVKPRDVGESQLVMTQHGVRIQPEECASKLRTLRSKITELSEAVDACTDTACYATQAVKLAALNADEKQSKCLTPF